MLFLARILVIGAIFTGIGYAALFALGALVEPDKREITITLPPPKLAP